jgi:hypothetical protein
MGKVKIKLFWIFLFIFGLTKVSLVWAADTSLNLVTSPLPISLVTTPGSTVSAQLKIKNGGDQPETLQVGLMKFSAYGDEGQPRLLDRQAGDDYFDWVSFSENDFTVNPNEWKTITATINVPPTAAFGYYYAVTFSRKSEEISGGPRSTKVIGATATLILLEVRVPNAVRNIEVLDFSTPRQIYEFLPVNFNIKLKNTGNVHVAPTGNIFIDHWGETKDTAILTVNDLKGSVLPDSNRVFESDWTDGFPVYQQKTDGNKVALTDRAGKPINELKWDFSQVPKLRWGKYTANLLLVYDDGTKDVPIEGKLTFWVIPWRIIGGGTIVLLLVLVGLYSIVKAPIKRIVGNKKKNNL